MAASMDKKDQLSDMSQSLSQPNPTTPSILGTTGGNKRPNPTSPDLFPSSQTQTLRPLKRRNSYGDLRDVKAVASKKATTTRKNLSDKILEALSSPEILNAIIPVLADKISESLSSNIEVEVQRRVSEQLQPLKDQVEAQAQTIEIQKQKMTRQFIDINSLQTATQGQIQKANQQAKDLEYLNNKIAELEFRLENQEQYSRRTSLRFHNISVPIDERGRIQHPVDTDQLVLNIINNKLQLKNITINDIGRSHVIGKVHNGKSQVIVRFLSYRARNLVYTSKKQLKGDRDGHYITENLTKHRTMLVQKLSKMKFDNEIDSYWTFDGRIFAKRTSSSRKMVIKDFYDINDLRSSVDQRSDQRPSSITDDADLNELVG